jgi:hypothetical protein
MPPASNFKMLSTPTPFCFMAYIMALLHDIHLTENEEGYQFKAIDPTWE